MSNLMTSLPLKAAWLFSFALVATPAFAVVRLPAVLSDHMVLQRGPAVPIWGWAAPREKVTVSFGAQRRSTHAAADGRWRLDLDLRHAGTGELSVEGGDNKLVVHDVLVGEVWLAAGQSNMVKPLGDQRGQKPTIGAAEEIAAANHPTIRLFKVAGRRESSPAEEVNGQWVVCGPDTIDAIKFSAAAYFFGRRLQDELGLPVGLIEAAVGGTRIEPWTPAGLDGKVVSRTDRPPTNDNERAPADAALFNAMVAPLAPFALKGVIWYQGESNVVSSEDMASYTQKMEALVYGWRRHWHAELPFYYVQIAPHLYHVVRRAKVPDPDTAPQLREAQADALRIPGTGMVVTNDLADDLKDIHPRDKKSVGIRLANLALVKTYGRTGLPYSGPVFSRVVFHESSAIVEFDHANGLRTRDGQSVQGFEIAGTDGYYVPGEAVVAGRRVVVNSPLVRSPTAVRYGWLDANHTNLVNGSGLPVRPFRSLRPNLRVQTQISKLLATSTDH